jgi:hypothetical protein
MTYDANIQRLTGTLRATLQALAACSLRDSPEDTVDDLRGRARELIASLTTAIDALPLDDASAAARATSLHLAQRLEALEDAFAARVVH